MAEKQQDRVSIEFSNKQIFNRRTITNKDGNQVDLVSISLPSSSVKITLFPFESSI